MSSENEGKDIKAIALPTAVAAVAQHVANAATANSVLNVAVMTLVTSIVTVAIARWTDRSADRARQFCETLLNDVAKTPDEVAADLQARLEDPYIRDVIAEAIRAAMEAPDDAVVPVLAYMAKEYRESGKIDAFFRGMCSMLMACDADDVEDFRAIFGEAERFSAGAEVQMAFVDPGQLVSMSKPAKLAGFNDHHEVPTRKTHAFYLLKHYRLIPMGAGVSSREVLRFSSSQLARFAKLFAGPRPSP